jgi:hypothetical protein
LSRSRVEKHQKLLPPEAQGTGNIPGGKITDADNFLKERLPIINCECGAEILVVPDLQAMNRAIKTHADKHRKKTRNTQKKQIAPNKVIELLSQLTIIEMSKQKYT